TALAQWADFAELGLTDARPFEALARVEAATDLMEQVQRLLDDKDVHPAAPVVLAGAALEEALRSLVVGSAVQPTGKPGLASYAAALRQGAVIDKQDEKDITAWAGQRNEAAHGEFEKLSRERAQIMVDGLNLFMRKKLVTNL